MEISQSNRQLDFEFLFVILFISYVPPRSSYLLHSNFQHTISSSAFIAIFIINFFKISFDCIESCSMRFPLILPVVEINFDSKRTFIYSQEISIDFAKCLLLCAIKGEKRQEESGKKKAK